MASKGDESIGKPSGESPTLDSEAIYRLVDELSERILRGEHVDFEHELQSHPADADRLRDVFSSLDLLGMIQHSDALRFDSPDDSSAVDPVVGILGDFCVQREIGRGGMGVVYEAEQISLQRRVALKIFPFAGICAPRQLQRFQHEAKAAASLHHPHIVPVFAVGCERGVHFYAMQYIEGRSLACLIEECSSTTIDKENLSPTLQQIATWGIQAAEALDYAHDVGVIHRDIKPANLMLDVEGQIWVTDFGLAQIANADGLTMTGDILGTLRYMSPEQAVGSRGLVDQRTDVYSLGATLYELLTLHPVYAGSDRAELLNRIVHEEPTSIRRLNPAVPKELATIIHQALERDLNSRYSTASELADDLQRFLNEQPIRAKPPTFVDRCRKWTGRNRGVVRLTAIFGCLSLFAIGFAAFLFDRERQNRRLEQRQRDSEQQVALATQRGLAINRYVTQINLADRSLKIGNFQEARMRLSEAIPKEGEEDFRSFEWHYLWHATRDRDPPLGQHDGMAYCVRVSPNGQIVATGGQDGIRLWDAKTFAPLGHLTDHGTDVNGLSFSTDSSRIASAGDDLNVRIWSTRNWEVERVIPHKGTIVAAMFVPGRNLLVSAERHYRDITDTWIGEDVVRLCSTETWEEIGTLQRHDDQIQSLDVSPEGTLIATSSSDGTACIWDLTENHLRCRISHSPLEARTVIQCVKFANTAPWLATASGDGIVRVWSIHDGTLLATLTGRNEQSEFVAFSSDDRMIATGGHEHEISFWRFSIVGRSRHQLDLFIDSPTEVWGGLFLDKRHLITAGHDGAIRASDACDFRRLRRVLINDQLSNIRFSTDSQHLKTIGNKEQIFRVADGIRLDESPNFVREFDDVQQNTRQENDRIPGRSPGDRTIISSESNVVAVIKESGRLQIWRDARLVSDAVFNFPNFKVGAISSNGLRLAVADHDGLIHMIDTRESKLEGELLVTPTPSELTFSNDAATLVSVWYQEPLKLNVSVTLLNVPTGRQLLELETGCLTVSGIKFSPDGRTLAAIGRTVFGSNEILLWTTNVRPKTE